MGRGIAVGDFVWCCRIAVGGCVWCCGIAVGRLVYLSMGDVG
ncbi:hypothetical protein [Blautia hominis]